MVMVAILIWPQSNSAVRLRKKCHAQGARYDVLQTTSPIRRRTQRIGIAQALTAMIARLNSGGTLLEACEDMHGSRFATARLTHIRLLVMFEKIRLPDETYHQAVRVSQGVHAAAQVSERLGCRASPCLEVVLAAYRQMRLLQHAQEQALAVPKATVGLLSALPAATVALGELMGAHPLNVLLGSTRGLVCLISGGCSYAVGLLWVQALIRKHS